MEAAGPAGEAGSGARPDGALSCCTTRPGGAWSSGFSLTPGATAGAGCDTAGGGGGDRGGVGGVPGVQSMLGDVWSALTDARFPVCAAVLMADDRRMWRPAPDAADLWIRLRILGLAKLWKAHCRRVQGTATPMPSVLAGFVSRVRAVIASDAALVDPDRPRYAMIAGDTVRTPLPAFTRAAFLSRWGVRDILLPLCTWLWPMS